MAVIWIIVSIAVIAVDQLTKYLASTYLKPIGTFPIIEGALHLTYVENKGAAFGILSDNRWIFMSISTVAIIAIAVLMVVFRKKYYHPLLYTGACMVLGGGIGNMIDRFAYGYVVDFIDFRLINFAVFNAADCFVCVGAALVAVYLLFFEPKEKKDRAVEAGSEGAQVGEDIAADSTTRPDGSMPSPDSIARPDGGISGSDDSVKSDSEEK